MPTLRQFFSMTEAEYAALVTAFHAGEYEQTFRFFLPLAEAGHAEAQGIIGNMFHLGLGRPANLTEAMKWYMRSAEQGYPPALHNIGSIYQAGGFNGTEPDLAKAKDWYERSRALGAWFSQKLD